MAKTITFDSPGEVHVEDLTDRVIRIVGEQGIQDGLVCVFTSSSTSAITTLEFEPGLAKEDLPAALDRLFPRHGMGVDYGHQRIWQDGNRHSHVRAAFLGPSLVVPIADGRLTLGRWQQIVFVDLDNKPRQRTVHVQTVPAAAPK